MPLYEVISENLTGLGSQGTERTWRNWTKYADDLVFAKKLCQQDYNKQTPGSLPWQKNAFNKKEWTTGDLRYVMYTIRPVEIEKETK